MRDQGSDAGDASTVFSIPLSEAVPTPEKKNETQYLADRRRRRQKKKNLRILQELEAMNDDESFVSGALNSLDYSTDNSSTNSFLQNIRHITSTERHPNQFKQASSTSSFPASFSAETLTKTWKKHRGTWNKYVPWFLVLVMFVFVVADRAGSNTRRMNDFGLTTQLRNGVERSKAKAVATDTSLSPEEMTRSNNEHDGGEGDGVVEEDGIYEEKNSFVHTTRALQQNAPAYPQLNQFQQVQNAADLSQPLLQQQQQLLQAQQQQQQPLSSQSPAQDQTATKNQQQHNLMLAQQLQQMLLQQQLLQQQQKILGGIIKPTLMKTNTETNKNTDPVTMASTAAWSPTLASNQQDSALNVEPQQTPESSSLPNTDTELPNLLAAQRTESLSNENYRNLLQQQQQQARLEPKANFLTQPGGRTIARKLRARPQPVLLGQVSSQKPEFIQQPKQSPEFANKLKSMSYISSGVRQL